MWPTIPREKPLSMEISWVKKTLFTTSLQNESITNFRKAVAVLDHGVLGLALDYLFGHC